MPLSAAATKLRNKAGIYLQNISIFYRKVPKNASQLVIIPAQLYPIELIKRTRKMAMKAPGKAYCKNIHLKSTFHKIDPKHLEWYVEEFAGHQTVPELDTGQQISLSDQRIQGKRLKYQDLIA